MRRDQLEHAIRAACDIAQDSELWIFGSQAILGEHPDAPASLCTSIEVDVQPKNRPEAADLIDGALGELSMFHATHGFYVHGLQISAAKLPDGWQGRAKPVMDPERTRGKTGWCVETHDLAVSKLAAGREKDRDFARTLLKEGLVQGSTLRERILALDIDKQHRVRLLKWIDITLDELGDHPSPPR